MKKIANILVRIVVMLVVCVITAYFVNIFQNRNYKNLSAEMQDSAIPFAYISYGDSLINCMHGYTGDVDTALLRESITPVGDDKTVSVCVENDGGYAESYSYEIRSISGDSLIENGDLEAADDGNGYDKMTVSIRMDLRADMEYMLVIVAHTEDGDSASYYTRIVVNDNYHQSELLDAVWQFHDATFDYEALESDSVITAYKNEYTGAAKTDDYGLGHSDLSDAYATLTWNGLEPEKVSPVNTTIREIDTNYAIVRLDYNMKSSTDQDVISYYSVSEYYKISYTEVADESASGEGAVSADESTVSAPAASDGEDSDAAESLVPKIVLRSFDRYVDEFFDRTAIDAINNVYEIGIVSSDDLECRYTQDNKKLSFVRNSQLWLYDYENGLMNLVYSPWQADDYDDTMYGVDASDVNIIDMDEDCNITFAVYGYMARGEHAGKLGIALYSFNYSTLVSDELLFVECDVPYEAMKNETSRLTYYDGTTFYYMLGDKVNAVDVAQKKQSYIADNLTARDVKVSDDMQVMAYGVSDNQAENSALTLMNLKTGQSYDIAAQSGECLVCYGFKDSDMVYGVADTADSGVGADKKSFKSTRYNDEDATDIPAKALYIVNSDGQQVKEYSKAGVYLMQVEIETNLLYLTRGEKSGDSFTAVKDDFITFKEDEENEVIATTHKTSITGYNRLYFTVPSNIYLSYTPNLNMAKYKLDKKAVNMVTTTVRDEVTYHVYDSLGLVKIYDVAGDAINYASSVAGIVVSSDGEIIYRETASQEFNTIAAGIFHKSSGSVDASLQDCMYMVLTYEGAQVDYDNLTGQTDALTAMNEYGTYQAIDVTGLSIDMMLSYVSNGVPVISRIDDGRYVLVVSYNSTDIRYYDPVQDEEIVVSRDEYDALMDKCDREMYTYNKE